MTVTAQNDAPTLSGDLAADVANGASVTLTAADVTGADVDDADSALTFVISAVVGGEVRVNGAAATTFTLADLTGGLVTFQHNGIALSAGFSVLVRDDDTASSTG